MEGQLLRAQLWPRQHGHVVFPPADVERVLWWSNYSAKAVALIQARGMPIDMTLWNLVQENKAAVVGELLRQFDASHNDDEPIYTPEGEWSYARFEQWLVRSGVAAWPRLESGLLNVDSDAFRLMSHVPGIEGLHALRDSLGFIVKAKLLIGHDGRNRPSLFHFGTATGRNAHAKSLYNVHAGMRSFMVFPPDTIGVYLDWRTQEVGIAAAQSGDTGLMDAYRSGDIYHALAWAHARPRPSPLEGGKSGAAPAHEAAAAGDQLRHGRAIIAVAGAAYQHLIHANPDLETVARVTRRCPHDLFGELDLLLIHQLE
jgi:hypothetical protein